MGSFISTIRDVKLILKDLKITLKFTAKIVLKVHAIVEDVEQTVQELKTTVSNLSARLPTQTATQEKLLDETSATYLNEVVQSIETTAESVKISLANAVSVLASDDLLKNTNNALENLANNSGRNLSGVMSRWASVPDGIGDLVKQDCASLSEYIQTSKLSPLKGKISEMVEQGNEMRLTSTTPSTETNEPGFIKDIIATNDKHTIPRILVEEILFTGNNTEKIFKIPKPFCTNDYISNASKMKILPGQFHSEYNSRSEGGKNHVKLYELMQTKNARKYHRSPESQTEFQMEILPLLLMTLLQGFKSENTNGQKAINMSGDNQLRICLGQALMAEYLPCD
jgi:hypothetical protein